MGPQATQGIYYDPYDYEIDTDPHPVWKEMRDREPVYWNDRFGFFALSRFDDVWRAYLDTATFSSTHGVTLDMLDAAVEYPSMIFMDPPEHDVLRKLVGRAFTPRRINGLEESVRKTVRDLLDVHAGDDEFDYVEGFGAQVPPMVIGALLGVPVEDRDQVRRWFDVMMHREENQTEPTPEAMIAMGAVYEYCDALIAERRRNLGDDFVSALIESVVVEDGVERRLTDTELQNFFMLLAGAGVETVARLLSWAAVLLARNPEERAKLVADRGLVPDAVEELLRYEAPSPVNGRFTFRESEFHGVTIPAGSKVLLLNGSANRDDREFDDPDAFLVDRTIKRHISFGHGAHFCLGASLARLESRIALEETVARYPTWEIDESRLEMVRTSSVRGFHSVPISVR
jgi:cytochrome P450